ncbi:hypothetical protein SAMN06265370_102308 [Puniceibacterium sediminis]|uniref:Uncharacterized protein n=2 Tax=Puniceibacterium sediminis TaxID=1608407 RepID=A0A238VM38_9RHOB|nr:hypothetical protein SAMN06265370_102308 [Puniceibacterium sediminis]
MVDYSSICVVSYQEGKGDVGELSKIEGSINLMMNWNDKDYLELNRTMKALSRASVPIENDDGRKMDEIYKAYFKVCNAILKREWKRLKDDLRKKQV